MAREEQDDYALVMRAETNEAPHEVLVGADLLLVNTVASITTPRVEGKDDAVVCEDTVCEMVVAGSTDPLVSVEVTACMIDVVWGSAALYGVRLTMEPTLVFGTTVLAVLNGPDVVVLGV